MRPWSGFSSQTSRVWFNSRTGDAYSANDDDNHTNGVFQNLELFGLTPEKLAQYGIDPKPERVHDYYGPLLFAAMREGWVRLRIDAREPDYKSNAEGFSLRDIRKAVIWYTEQVGMPKQFIIATRTGPGDHEGQGWRLNEDQLEFFMQKGVIPRDLLNNSYHPMRRFMNLIAEALIDEAGAGPSRIVKHIRAGVPFITISAMRGDNDHKTNMKLTRELHAELSRMPVSLIEIEGEYEETLADDTKQKQPELSFFVMPTSRIGPLALDRFLQIGLLLCQKYRQQEIGFGDGESIYLVNRHGERNKIGDAVTFAPKNVMELPGFSEIKGRKFSFTHLADHPQAVPYSA